jgi:hypothetical protein
MAELGAGIMTFHRFLLTVIVLFLVLTVIHWPVLSTFMGSDFFNSESDIFLQSTLGNLGFSQTVCLQSSMIKGNDQKMTCQTGEITELIDWGVATRFEDQQMCRANSEGYCHEFLNRDLVKSMFEQNCKGNTACQFKEFSQFIKNDTNSNPAYVGSCLDSESRIFFQYTCT